MNCSFVLKLYDSLTREKKPFQPANGDARIYVCGITPYDVTHAGHAFLVVTFDVLRRYLEYRGQGVRHVQNLTDIDDDMVRKSRETGIPVFELALTNDAIYQADLRALNVLPPHEYPRASECVEKIQEIVAVLLERGSAYEDNGNVFFDVASFPNYGRMSNESTESLAKRPDIPLAGRGRAPLDFLLWQRVTEPDEPSWDSPWGLGRPGWHVECSAMCLQYLGDQVDIHGGGSDLIFPHHESEIAQSESFTGAQPFVFNWLHVGMLRYEGEKMSKSLGNLVLVRHLLTRYPPEALRLYFGSMHYRASEEFSEGELARWGAVYRDRLLPALGIFDGDGDMDVQVYVRRFEAAIDDDLDTPTALAVLDEMAGAVLSTGSPEGRAALQHLCALFGIETP
ncbi:MAG: cysteine--tRNA ligase [Dehalococcoidia bacterium]|nr:cysteine--tRNA ligase [Dehalococcoidia bacterium]